MATKWQATIVNLLQFGPIWAARGTCPRMAKLKESSSAPKANNFEDFGLWGTPKARLLSRRTIIV